MSDPRGIEGLEPMDSRQQEQDERLTLEECFYLQDQQYAEDRRRFGQFRDAWAQWAKGGK